MKFLKHEDYICGKLDEADYKLCDERAEKMCGGASTYSYKNSQMQNHDVYNIGNIGELTVWEMFKKLEQRNELKILHQPFRDSYGSFNPKDDFIIERNGVKTQIEVRTKGRNVDPIKSYEQCTDCIRPHLFYIFNSYNRKNDCCFIVGMAGWDELSEHAFPVLKGTDNHNFKHKTDEFEILIKDLIPPIQWAKNSTKVKE